MCLRRAAVGLVCTQHFAGYDALERGDHDVVPGLPHPAHRVHGEVQDCYHLPAPWARSRHDRGRHHRQNWPAELDIPSLGVKAKFGQPIVQVWDGKEWTITPPEDTWEDLQRVYWWKEHELPGPTQGTAYVYAHACPPSTQCAFNKLRLAKVGAMVRVVTDTYVATYRIVPIDPHQPFAGVQQYAKTVKGIGSSTSSVANFHVPGRLVLITCGYASDGSSPFNWVAFAQLVSVRRA
jgi:hypothetical protein